MADYGLYFDGEDDYTSTPYSNVFEFDGDKTFIIMFKSKQQSGQWRKLASMGAFAAGGWVISFDEDGDRVQFLFASDTGWSGETSWLTVGFNSSVMYAVVADYTNTLLKTYLNGQHIFDNALPTYYLTDGTKDLHIGRSSSGEYSASDVYLVLLYDRALSDTEIQQIYNDPTNPPTDGLVLWLAPDSVDTTNDIWTDKSGNNNDGTIYGCLYIPTRWTTKDGVLTIEEIWELNTVRFNYPWPASIKNKINRVVEVMPTLNNTYVVFDKALGGEEVTFTFYLDPDYDDDEKIRSEILSSGIVKIRTPDLRYYGDYVVKSIDWDIDAFNKHILKLTAVRV